MASSDSLGDSRGFFTAKNACSAAAWAAGDGYASAPGAGRSGMAIDELQGESTKGGPASESSSSRYLNPRDFTVPDMSGACTAGRPEPAVRLEPCGHVTNAVSPTSRRDGAPNSALTAAELRLCRPTFTEASKQGNGFDADWFIGCPVRAREHAGSGRRAGSVRCRGRQSGRGCFRTVQHWRADQRLAVLLLWGAGALV